MEKKLRIEFIVGLIITVAGFVWYASDINSLVRALDGRLAKVEISNAADGVQRAAVGERITRIEGKQELAVEILNRVEARLNELHKRRD